MALLVPDAAAERVDVLLNLLAKEWFACLLSWGPVVGGCDQVDFSSLGMPQVVSASDLSVFDP